MRHDRIQELEAWFTSAEPELFNLIIAICGSRDVPHVLSYLRTRFKHCRARTYAGFLTWALSAAERQAELVYQFNTLYSEHRGIVRAAIWRIVRSIQHADPETIFETRRGTSLQNSAVQQLEQQVWAKLWELLPSYQSEKSKVSTWAFMIATGEARTHRNKRLRRMKFQTVMPDIRDGDGNLGDPVETLGIPMLESGGFAVSDWTAIHKQKIAK